MLYLATGQGRFRGRAWQNFERAIKITDSDVAGMAEVQGVAPHYARELIAMCEVLTLENVTEIRNLKIKKL